LWGGVGKKRVAVVGAGVSGLACARVLAEAGIDVRVFDKGHKAPGGRVHSRSVYLVDGHAVGVRSHQAATEVLSFDDGAQYFTTREPEFRAFVQECVAEGCVREWPLRVASIYKEGEVQLQHDRREEGEAKRSNTRYVGYPTMHSFIPFLAQPVAHTIHQSLRVVDILVCWICWMMRRW
jgi:predicted NAD/FAD-dependent oxidoreductase